MSLRSIKIQNFRSFEELEIEELKRVNLISGRNNSGKSSFLEALFFIAGMSHPEIAIKINIFRHMSIGENRAIDTLFNSLDLSKTPTISAKIKGQTRELSLEPIYNETNSFDSSANNVAWTSQEKSNQLVGLELSFKEDISDTKKTSKIMINNINGSNQILRPNNYREKINAIYINSDFLLQMDNEILYSLDKLIINKKKYLLLDILKKIEPSLCDILITSDRQIVVDIGEKKYFPLSLLGDGIKRILGILSIVFSDNINVILIDEIENGLHYSALKVLWEVLIDISKEKYLQIVATTHSDDCIWAFSKAGEKADQKKDLEYIRIEKLDKKHKANIFSFENLKSGLENNFEVR